MSSPAADLERYVDEPPKPVRPSAVEDTRGAFARDRARVLHSAAFRRLAAKTQVHAAGPVRRRLPADPADPLARGGPDRPRDGRASWAATRTWWTPPGWPTTSATRRSGTTARTPSTRWPRDCGGFEGNAQTLRVLVRLEAKVVGPDGESAGLNLTRASLDAACKYPWPRRAGNRKFGVYADDVPVFDWLRAGARPAEPAVPRGAGDGLGRRRGVLGARRRGRRDRRVRPAGALLRDADERAALCRDVAEVYSPESPDVLGGALAGLLAEPALAAVAGFDGAARALVGAQARRQPPHWTIRGRPRSTPPGPGPAPGRCAATTPTWSCRARSRAQCALLKGIACGT